MMIFRRPRNSSALRNTTRPLDAYQYSHILLPTFRISNLIRLSTVANLPLPPISRPTLVTLPTTSTSLNLCLLVLNKPLQQLPPLSQPKLSASLRLQHLVRQPPVQQPLPRLVPAAQIPEPILRVKLFTPLQSRLTKVLFTRVTRFLSILIAHLIIQTTVRSATLQFLTALMSARSVSLLSPLLVQPLVRPITAVPVLSLATSRPIACNFPPPGWQKMLPSADFRGCLVPLLLRMPFFFPVCKN